MRGTHVLKHGACNPSNLPNTKWWDQPTEIWLKRTGLKHIQSVFHTIDAIFGPVAELIFASLYLQDYTRLLPASSLPSSNCDYFDCRDHINLISAKIDGYISDVAGLAIASCVFVMSKFENFYFQIKLVVNLFQRFSFSVSGIFGLALLILTSKRICCQGKFLQFVMVL